MPITINPGQMESDTHANYPEPDKRIVTKHEADIDDIGGSPARILPRYEFKGGNQYHTTTIIRNEGSQQSAGRITYERGDGTRKAQRNTR